MQCGSPGHNDLCRGNQYSDVTWGSWCRKSPTTRLFVHLIALDKNKGNSDVLLCEENPVTYGFPSQRAGYAENVSTSSWWHTNTNAAHQGRIQDFKPGVVVVAGVAHSGLSPDRKSGGVCVYEIPKYDYHSSNTPPPPPPPPPLYNDLLKNRIWNNLGSKSTLAHHRPQVIIMCA